MLSVDAGRRLLENLRSTRMQRLVPEQREEKENQDRAANNTGANQERLKQRPALW